MKTVLDLGAFDGNASRYLVTKGDRWILVDNGQWKQYGWDEPMTPEGAKRIECDIMDYADPAELVFCSNVLYHHPDPWAFMNHLRELTLETLHLRTYYDKGPGSWIRYDKDKNPAHADPKVAATIFYRPTIKGLTDELALLGMRVDELTAQDGLLSVVCSI